MPRLVACEDLSWRKSSRSASGSQVECVECAITEADTVCVRDSKAPAYGMLAFSMTTWLRFVRGRRLGTPAALGGDLRRAGGRSRGGR